MSDDFDFIIIQTKHAKCGDCTFKWDAVNEIWKIDENRCFKPAGSTEKCECIDPLGDDGNFPPNPNPDQKHTEDCYHSACGRCFWICLGDLAEQCTWRVRKHGQCPQIPGCYQCSIGDRPPAIPPPKHGDVYSAPCQPQGPCCRSRNDGGGQPGLACEWSIFDDDHNINCASPGPLGGKYGCITVPCIYDNETTACDVLDECVTESNAACDDPENCPGGCVKTDTGFCIPCTNENDEIECRPVMKLECKNPNEDCGGCECVKGDDWDPADGEEGDVRDGKCEDPIGEVEVVCEGECQWVWKDGDWVEKDGGNCRPPGGPPGGNGNGGNFTGGGGGGEDGCCDELPSTLYLRISLDWHTLLGNCGDGYADHCCHQTVIALTPGNAGASYCCDDGMSADNRVYEASGASSSYHFSCPGDDGGEHCGDYCNFSGCNLDLTKFKAICCNDKLEPSPNPYTTIEYDGVPIGCGDEHGSCAGAGTSSLLCEFTSGGDFWDAIFDPWVEKCPDSAAGIHLELYDYEPTLDCYYCLECEGSVNPQ